jgi:hypothetical protein
MRTSRGEFPGPIPGWYAVSVKALHYPDGGLQYFREFNPVARIGYSMLLFEIDEATAADYHSRLTNATMRE